MIAVLPQGKPTRPDLARSDRKSPAAPGCNVLKEGFLTPIANVPEDFASVYQQSKVYFYSLNPRNDYHAWLVEDVAICTMRLDRISRIERRERDKVALRAEHFWDEDRRAEVEAKASRLAKHPAATVRALERTPHGCEWLMGRWAMLARAADLRGGTWDEEQTALAFDLLGTPSGLRLGTPGERIDGHGRPIGEAADPATIARGEVDRLATVRDAVTDADALDRAMAMADLADAASPELRRLRRYEATLHKRMRWCLFQLQQEPKWADPHPDLRYLYPATDPEAAAPKSEAAPAPAPAPGRARPKDDDILACDAPIPAYLARAARPEPSPARAEARRQAKRGRADRPRE